MLTILQVWKWPNLVLQETESTVQEEPWEKGHERKLISKMYHRRHGGEAKCNGCKWPSCLNQYEPKFQIATWNLVEWNHLAKPLIMQDMYPPVAHSRRQLLLSLPTHLPLQLSFNIIHCKVMLKVQSMVRLPKTFMVVILFSVCIDGVAIISPEKNSTAASNESIWEVQIRTSKN
jgi:hypothetical protein